MKYNTVQYKNTLLILKNDIQKENGKDVYGERNGDGKHSIKQEGRLLY